MANVLQYLWKEITRPMPLERFGDYNEYWQKRKDLHSTSDRYPPLHRARLIAEYIEPDSTILDIGCGDATLMEYLSSHTSPRKIVGIDISKESARNAIEKGYEAHEMDVTSEQFADFINNNNFDYIILTELLEHIRDPEQIMLLIKKNFNKSIFVSIPNAGYFAHRLRLLFGRFPIVVIMYHVQEHIRFWTHKDFLYWCSYLGYQVKNTRAGSAFLNVEPLGDALPSLFAIQNIYELTK